jgi:hypothetical protein
VIRRPRRRRYVGRGHHDGWVTSQPKSRQFLSVLTCESRAAAAFRLRSGDLRALGSVNSDRACSRWGQTDRHRPAGLSRCGSWPAMVSPTVGGAHRRPSGMWPLRGGGHGRPAVRHQAPRPQAPATRSGRASEIDRFGVALFPVGYRLRRVDGGAAPPPRSDDTAPDGAEAGATPAIPHEGAEPLNRPEPGKVLETPGRTDPRGDPT